MAISERKELRTERPSIFDRYPELRAVPKNRFPRNVFVIPDGNARWANLKGVAIQIGHAKGAEVIVNAFKDLSELGEFIPFVGVWGFSIDNLTRPKKEVDFLMSLFDKTIQSLRPDLQKRNQRFVHIGRKDVLGLGSSLSETIRQTEDETKNNFGQTIYVALGFGGEDQEVRVVQKAVDAAMSVDYMGEIIKGYVQSLRDGEGVIPSADLIIRSSGEYRLSDVGWIQGKGTELYFDKKLFPSFTTGDFVKAIVNFSRRERRFGSRSSR